MQQIQNSSNEKLTSLKKLLDDMSQQITKDSIKLNDTSTKISLIKKKLSNIDKSKINLVIILSFEDELKQELKRKEKELKAEEDKTDKETAAALAIVDKFNKAFQVGLDIYNKYKNDKAKLDALCNSIEESERKLLELKQYEEAIYSIIGPMVKDIEDDLKDVANKLDKKSEVELDLTKWKVQSALKDMKLQMQQLTSDFKVEPKLLRCIDKLEEVMTTLINIYGRIRSYQEQQNLANYIADISSVSASQIQISDPKIRKALQQLEKLIRSNLVLKQYATAEEAFQQWVFPFAQLFIKNFTLPTQFELEKNIDNLVSKAVAKIEEMKSSIDIYHVSVKKGYDEYILTDRFYSKYVSSEPFYVWKNRRHEDMISKLLSGQEVVLKADIMESDANKTAIKFSFIELYFKTPNGTMQSLINETLKGFDIQATHMGNSYYRYAQEIYVITSSSQTIYYSFEKDDGEPIRKNHVYDKMKAGDLLLSPYALWKFKLINKTPKFTFADLGNFKEEVDLELSGYGSYAIKDYTSNFICDRVKADKYYPLDDNSELKVEVLSDNKSLSFNTAMDSFVIDMADYITNSAASGLSSPINNVFQILKRHVLMVAASLLQALFVSKENISNENKTLLTETTNGMEGEIKVIKELLIKETETKGFCRNPDSSDGASFILNEASFPSGLRSGRLQCN